jgi:hypothetical protein
MPRVTELIGILPSLTSGEGQGGRRDLNYDISCKGHVILADPGQGLLSSESLPAPVANIFHLYSYSTVGHL